MGTRLPRSWQVVRSSPGLRGPLLVLFVAALGALVGGGGIHADSECAVPPNNLTAALNADGSAIVLIWEASGACVPDTYAVYRRVMADEPKVTKFADVDGQSLSYTDTAIAAGKTYRYRIRSNDQGDRTAVADVTAPDRQSTPKAQQEPRNNQQSVTLTPPSSGDPINRNVLPRAILPRYIVTFVSNVNASQVAGSRDVSTHMYAQGFTTGTATTGYNLASVVLLWQESYPTLTPGATTVTIHADDSGAPADTALYTMESPSRYGAGLNVFEAPEDTTLDANTTYHVVMRFSNTNGPNWSQTNYIEGPDDGVYPGWSISEGYHTKPRDSSDDWTASTGRRSMRIQVRGTIVDNTAPTLSTATIDRASLVLTYNEELDVDSIPKLSSFYAVNVNGTGVSKSGPTISGDRVILTLDAPVVETDSVTVSYTVPATDAVQDTSANLAAAFSNYSVNNITDNTPPTISVATVDRDTLVLRYNEPLDSGSTPAASAFTVEVDGSSVAILSTVVISRLEVSLTLASAVSRSDDVTISYTAPSTNPLQDESGNDAGSLSDHAVHNQSVSSNNVVFYSTLSKRFWGGHYVGSGLSNTALHQRAQRFTTGSAEHGYVIESVVIDVDKLGANASPQVAITHDDSGDPGTVLHTLQPPPGLADGELTFLALPNSRLEPDTNYWILVSNGNEQAQNAARFRLRYTYQNGVDSGGLAGWSVANEGEWATGPSFENWALQLFANFGFGILHKVTGLIATDATRPTITALRVAGRSLILTYDENLDGGSEPAPGAFTVTVDGAEITVSSVDVSAQTVTLTLASGVSFGSSVSLTYTAPQTNPIRDLAQNAALALNNRAVETHNSPPVFNSGLPATISVSENASVGADVGDPFAATDFDGDTLTYALDGNVAGHFEITANGQIRTTSALDFETRASYSVIVQVHDGKDEDDQPSTDVDVTWNVTITIENVDEPGSVTLNSASGEIQALVEITATLTDEDKFESADWQWWRSANGTSNWAEIENAAASSYTPTADDQGSYLRATASYTDNQGPGKQASQVSGRVGAPPPVNSRPVFPASETGRREIPENSSADSNIGDPIAATDVNAGDPAVNDPLVYALSGADAASFEIDEGTGQLTLAQNTTLDFESKRIYRVTRDGPRRHRRGRAAGSHHRRQPARGGPRDRRQRGPGHFRRGERLGSGELARQGNHHPGG